MYSVFNSQTQKVTLTSAGGIAFRIDDAKTPGSTNTANFTKVFALNNQADPVGNISRQLGDLDHTLNVVLQVRAQVGSNVQVLTAIQSETSASVVSNTKVQAGIEDADIAKVVSEFS